MSLSEQPTSTPPLGSPPDASDQISDNALGALNYLWRKAHLDDDWTKGGEISAAWDRWSYYPLFATPRYDITWGVRAAAKIGHQLPAWREGVTEIIDLHIQRMISYASWHDWVEQPGLDPNRGNYPFWYYQKYIPTGMAGVYNAPGYCGNGLSTQQDGFFACYGLAPAEAKPAHPYTYDHAPANGREYDPDPIYGNGCAFLMFKGYLLEQLGQYYAISGDDKYRKPFDIIYDDDIRFSYSHEEIAEVLSEQHAQPVDSQFSSMAPGIDCEVGKSFPLCIAVGGLGLRLHDNLFGTDYLPPFEDWIEWAKVNAAISTQNDGLLDRVTLYYDRDLSHNHNPANFQAAFIHAATALHCLPFAPDWARQLYESSLELFGRRQDDGGLGMFMLTSVSNTTFELQDRGGGPVMMALAHEFGDTETLDAMRLYAASDWGPQRENHEFWYDFGIPERFPRGILNDFAWLADVGEPGSFAAMYDSADTSRLNLPTVVDIDFPTVGVRRARGTPTGELHLGIVSQSEKRRGERTSFRVTQLDPRRTRSVCQDGHQLDAWQQLDNGDLIITTTIDDHDFVVS
jgi:hypothetical protein